MTLDSLLNPGVVLLAVVVLFFGVRRLRFRGIRMQLPELIRAGAVVVDVRSRAEFAAGSRKDSINIPLDELASGLKKLNRSQPVILCCASGARSAAAVRLFRQAGFDRVFNAGPWTNIPA